MKPLINDITTDPYNPPQFRDIARLPGNIGRDMSYPKKNIEVQEKEYGDILPVKSKFRAPQTFALCKRAAESMSGWKLVSEDPKLYTLEYVATTLLLRFKDDVIIVVSEEQTGSTLHMRSKSRLGKGDLGANADRIRKYILKFRELEEGS